MAANDILISKIKKWCKATTTIVKEYTKLGQYAQPFDSIISNLEKYDSPVNIEEDIKNLEGYLDGCVQSDFSTAIRDFCTQTKTTLIKNYTDFRCELKDRNFWAELKKIGYSPNKDEECKRLEKERLEKERLEKERLEKERRERERLEWERLEKERRERERLEWERSQKERREKERLEKERLEKKSIGPQWEVVEKKQPDTPKKDYYHFPEKSAWEKFDDFITGIGDWFANNIDDAPELLTGILCILYIICAIIATIAAWINEGIGYAILMVVIAAIVGYICFWAIFIVQLISKFIMGILRLYFYSGASFLIVNILIATCIVFSVLDNNSSSSRIKSQTEISAPATTEYICIANEFINIRVSPNTQANVLGKVKRGETVQVYEIKNGFAKVKWGTGYGYANAKYIKKKN